MSLAESGSGPEDIPDSVLSVSACMLCVMRASYLISALPFFLCILHTLTGRLPQGRSLSSNVVQRLSRLSRLHSPGRCLVFPVCLASRTLLLDTWRFQGLLSPAPSKAGRQGSIASGPSPTEPGRRRRCKANRTLPGQAAGRLTWASQIARLQLLNLSLPSDTSPVTV